VITLIDDNVKHEVRHKKTHTREIFIKLFLQTLTFIMGFTDSCCPTDPIWFDPSVLAGKSHVKWGSLDVNKGKYWFLLLFVLVFYYQIYTLKNHGKSTNSLKKNVTYKCLEFFDSM